MIKNSLEDFPPLRRALVISPPTSEILIASTQLRIKVDDLRNVTSAAKEVPI
jgi:hypothetical protein